MQRGAIRTRNISLTLRIHSKDAAQHQGEIVRLQKGDTEARGANVVT